MPAADARGIPLVDFAGVGVVALQVAVVLGHARLFRDGCILGSLDGGRFASFAEMRARQIAWAEVWIPGSVQSTQLNPLPAVGLGVSARCVLGVNLSTHSGGFHQ